MSCQSAPDLALVYISMNIPLCEHTADHRDHIFKGPGHPES
ncbi:unnamed protein product, partial [Staurois parvus]